MNEGRQSTDPGVLGALLLLIGFLGPGLPPQEEETGDRPIAHNPYYQRTEWKVWRDDDSPVEDVQSMVREEGEEKAVRVTIEAPEAKGRVYPLDPPGEDDSGPLVAYEAREEASPIYAGIWDDVYSSWSGLHGYVRSRWKAADGSELTVRGHIIDFVDVAHEYMLPLGVNFIHQSTTGMSHLIANGGRPARTEAFEKLYFADVLVCAPAHASLTDQRADRSSDLIAAHLPTLFNSVGSSNSETMAITKMIAVGGYLPPETKRLLKRNGLYPAAMLYLWKAGLPYAVPYGHELRHRVAYKSVGDRRLYPESYSSAGIDKGDLCRVYHCYDDLAHMRNMVSLARSMDVAPPEAVFRVLDVSGGRSVYELRKAALVIQEEGEDAVVRVSSEGCYDLQGLPLQTRWQLLYGNRWTSVEPVPEERSTVVITVPWDDALPEGRTAIALLADNGRFEGNPAIVTVFRRKGEGVLPGHGQSEYQYDAAQANLRPVVLGLQDRAVRRGRALEIPLRAIDPEGFPLRFHLREGDPGEIDGDLYTWRCPRKEPEGARSVAFIASDGTSGNGYAGRTIAIHVGEPELLARIEAEPLCGPAPLTVEVSARDSICSRRKTEYGWDFYAPALGREPKAFEELVPGREAEHTFEEPGVYEIALEVRDGSESDVETLRVLVTREALPDREAAIEVEGSGVRIREGDDSPSAFDGTDFGEAPVRTPVLRSFRLVNAGDRPLTLARKGALELSGPHAREFKVARRPRPRIDGRGSSLFELRFEPREEGPRAATLTIRAGSETFAFALRGAGTGR